MGIRGLKSLIENKFSFVIDEYELKNTKVIIDACNLSCTFAEFIHRDERDDLFGGDLVLFGREINRLFDRLSRCQIEPILVFDGASRQELSESRTKVKTDRARKVFEDVMSINAQVPGKIVIPENAIRAFRSIMLDRGVSMVQSLYEPWADIAQLSRDHKCPVISNNSDFYLFDLPYGYISTDSIISSFASLTTLSGRGDEEESLSDCFKDLNLTEIKHLTCSIFYRDKFLRSFPDLHKETIPLLGVLTKEEPIISQVAYKICHMPCIVSRMRNSNIVDGVYHGYKYHEKILKILHFLCGKTVHESINEILSLTRYNNRRELQGFFTSGLRIYAEGPIQDFKSELDKFVRMPFRRNHQDLSQVKLEEEYERSLTEVAKYFTDRKEDYHVLEFLQRDIVFWKSHMDDLSLPSANSSRKRIDRVLLQLIRRSPHDEKPWIVYDRVKYSYERTSMLPISSLAGLGPLNYTIFDIPRMTMNERVAIIMTTLHSNSEVLELDLAEHDKWLDTQHAKEFTMIKSILHYIDVENKVHNFQLWESFRRAVAFCILVHFLTEGSDFKLRAKLRASVSNKEPNLNLSQVIQNLDLSRRLPSNNRLMHQIAQLYSTISAYNRMNSFLGEILTRIRTEGWANSRLIYCLTEHLESHQLKYSRTFSQDGEHTVTDTFSALLSLSG